MGKGIPLQFKQAYPENFEAYRRACEAHEVRPGTMFVFDTGQLHPPKYIINFPTKRHWKDKSRLEDIETGLCDLAKTAMDLELRSMAIPALGCGNGGLEWDVVRPRIVEAFAATPELEVLVYGP